MKNLFRLTLMSVLLSLLSLAAFAGTTPDTMHISCEAPNSDHQTGLHRARGDSDVWTFQIALEGNARFVDGPYWDYPGKSGNDPDWGLWTGGDDGDSSLGWSSPEKSDKFSVRVNGQIVCGDGGDGEPIDFSAGWDGEVSYNAEIKVRRKDSGDEYSSSATVAVGGKSSSEHQADVKVIATDSDGNPMEGISVDAPTIEDKEGVETDASISPSSATTNSDGEALFTFTSSDIVGNVSLEQDGGESSASVQVTQDWTQLPDSETWEFDPYIDYDVASNVTFKMALKSDGSVSITNHDIHFETTEVSGWEWYSDAGEDWDGDGYPDGDYLYMEEQDYEDVADWYGEELVTYSGVSAGAAGHYTTQQTVHSNDDFWIDEVYFDAIDNNADDGQ